MTNGIGRGRLFIVYNRNKKGELTEAPYIHTLKTINVNEDVDTQHAIEYELANGNKVLIVFRPDIVLAYLDNPDDIRFPLAGE